MTVSACVIAHNEEKNIDRTLASLRWADEIVVVDCSSSDRTVRHAGKYTGQVFSRPNTANLNVNKNFSFDQASSEWILCVDADEVIPEALTDEIRNTTRGEPKENGFFVVRKNFWFGRWLKHGGHFPDRQLRLFRRGKGRFPERHVHERLAVEGTVGTLREPMEHYPYRSISHYLRKMDFYTSFEADLLRERGRRFTAGRFMLELVKSKERFFRRYIVKGGFLDGREGFTAAYLDFLSRIVTVLKLKE